RHRGHGAGLHPADPPRRPESCGGMSRPLSRRALALQRLAVLLALAILLAPVAWLIAVGYRPTSEVFSFPPRVFSRLTLENFRAIFALFDVPRLVWSSI